jgi:acetaldehyde dehydrogenase (acetylating)
MRNTIYMLVENENRIAIENAVEQMVKEIQSYVPGYRLKHLPDVDGNKVTVQAEVRGAGDHLPDYAGNLDIMTAAAVAVGEQFATERIARGLRE